jgi:hypothetical protein
MKRTSCCREKRIAGGPVGGFMGGSSGGTLVELDFRELQEEFKSFSSLLLKESFRFMFSVEDEPYCFESSAVLPHAGL